VDIAYLQTVPADRISMVYSWCNCVQCKYHKYKKRLDKKKRKNVRELKT